MRRFEEIKGLDNNCKMYLKNYFFINVLVDCIKNIFKLSLKFLVQSLTDGERQRERGRERCGQMVREGGGRERERTLYRKNLYTCLILYFRRKFYIKNIIIIICTIMKIIITIYRECLLSR